ncbi:MAG: hypothetical protein M5T61_13410 [Acidimicrobiia bacterium]|nr:hypothetical protein [Acidimicrobiia bacterium]
MTAFLRLLDAEIRRYWARRLVRVLLLLSLVVPTVVVAVLTARSSVKNETRETFVYSEEDCFEELPDGSSVYFPGCGDATPSETTSEVVRVDQRIDVVDDLADAVNGSGTTLMFLAVLIGASFLGAEIGAASLSTQLLYEPRRTLVWTAKAVAVGLGSALFSLAVLALLALELWGGAAWRGVVEGADADWVVARVGDVLRASGAAALAGMLAFGITGIARRTVAAVAGFLALGMIVEPALYGIFNVFDGRLPISALFAFASNSLSGEGGIDGIDSLLRAGTVAAIWAAGALAAGGVLFARREVR